METEFLKPLLWACGIFTVNIRDRVRVGFPVHSGLWDFMFPRFPKRAFLMCIIEHLTHSSQDLNGLNGMRSLTLVGPTCALSEAQRKLLFPLLLVPPHTATQLPREGCLPEAALFPPESSARPAHWLGDGTHASGLHSGLVAVTVTETFETWALHSISIHWIHVGAYRKLSE